MSELRSEPLPTPDTARRKPANWTDSARVSKRTVYDYFGDKESVFLAALHRAGSSLGSDIRDAIDEELSEIRDLREGLIAFTRRVTTEAFHSSAYMRFRRLADTARTLASRPVEGQEDPGIVFEQRIAEFVERGVLRTADPARAAQHFVALTFWVAREAFEDDFDDDAELDAALVDGVDAFIRAYAAA